MNLLVGTGLPLGFFPLLWLLTFLGIKNVKTKSQKWRPNWNRGNYLVFVKIAIQETQIQEALELCSNRLQKGGDLQRQKTQEVT